MVRYTVRKNRSCVFWSRALALGVVFFPLSLSHVDFRAAFSGHLAVSAVRSSPAFAAFEDTLADDASPGAFDRMIEPTQTLAAGTPWGARTLAPAEHRLALKGLTVRAPAAALDSDPSPEVLPALAIEQPAAAGPSVAKLPTRAAQSAKAALLASNVPASKHSLYIDEDSASAFTAAPVARATSLATIKLSDSVSARETDRALLLKGQVEMTGGLAFVGAETQLVVKRTAGGKSFENGRIWVTEGRFEIRVNHPTGTLVAELRRPDGRVLGRGELDIRNLEAGANRGTIENLRLALHPVADAAELRVVSAYSHDDQILPLENGRLEYDGAPGRPALQAASSFVARATARKNWPTLVVGQSDRRQSVKVYSDSMIEALIALNLSGTTRAEARHRAIVWGQVARGGQVLEGARVEMAEGQAPIYFDSAYLPDASLTGTGKNGLFAFVNVKPGTQAVRVVQGGRTYPAQVFPAEERHVSYLEFDLRDRLNSQFKVIDALEPKRKVNADLKLVGNDQSVTIGSEARVEFSVAGHTFMVEADAGPEFEISRRTVSGSPHRIDIPLVKREWLRRLSAERGVVTLPGQGVVAGFVDDQNFAVEFAGMNASVAKAGAPAPQVVYVDAKGKAVPGQHGVAGGGFVIFNAPVGLQTVYIHPAHAKESFSQVVVPESGLVHVMNYSADEKSN